MWQTWNSVCWFVVCLWGQAHTHIFAIGCGCKFADQQSTPREAKMWIFHSVWPHPNPKTACTVVTTGELAIYRNQNVLNEFLRDVVQCVETVLFCSVESVGRKSFFFGVSALCSVASRLPNRWRTGGRWWLEGYKRKDAEIPPPAYRTHRQGSRLLPFIFTSYHSVCCQLRGIVCHCGRPLCSRSLGPQ